jgi:hypothetical protein
MVRTPEVFSLHQAFRSYGEAVKHVPYTARYCSPARRLINNLRPSLASPGRLPGIGTTRLELGTLFVLS